MEKLQVNVVSNEIQSVIWSIPVVGCFLKKIIFI